MLITYRENDITGPEFADYYYKSVNFGSWTRRPLVNIMKDGQATGTLQGANPDALLSQALAFGETVYLTGESPINNVDIHVPTPCLRSMPSSRSSTASKDGSAASR